MLRSLLWALPLTLLITAWAPSQEFKIYTDGKSNEANTKGVKITAIPKAGIENEMGLKPGDTILKINGKNITNDKELGEALSKIQIHKVTEERKEPTTNLLLLRTDKAEPITISGWVLQSSFPDTKTGKVQFYFRSKELPKDGAKLKRTGS